VQVDEANVTGHPDDGPLAAAGINRVLDGVRGEKAVHLCYGNYGGQTHPAGNLRKLIAFLNALNADHVVLEIARRPEVELTDAQRRQTRAGPGDRRDRHQGQRGGDAREVARRIEKAARAVGAERIRYVHPDCGFWMLPRSVADGKMRTLVAGRNLFEGHAA
jgi:5-methyltetrahydropteroyltriglutamate--homocysteine methyltransferase